MKRLFSILLLTLSLMANAWSFESFVVKDIRVEGLQRISAGTVFNYLPLKVGETLTESVSSKAIRSLFKTGFFKDVRLERDGNILIIFVVERPSISVIKIEGNKDLDSEEMLDGLKQIGLAEGRVFDRSLLDKVEQELQRLYFSRGKYAVRIKSTVTPLERNRVGISIDISEGKVAKIHQINIVGNKVFSDEDLLDELELSTPTLLSFYTGVDKYSKQKLAADLERVRSYYLDRGYIGFTIDSTQVSITPDKKDVYITINVTEGDQFTIDKVKLAGELVLAREKLFKMVEVRAGDIFSRKMANETSDDISKALGDEGYAFANVNAIPEVNKEKKTVTMTFFIDPGKRVYVRRINFSGNTRTRDEVLRREMRQLEGAYASTDKIELSRRRLDRLAYFSDVTVETRAVPGVADQMDVNYSVVEKPSGNILAGLGYSQNQGIIFNASVSQNNFLGTGKRISVAFNNSDINTLYRFSFTNPYYTLDGVSRSFDFKYRKTDAARANISAFRSDEISAGMGFGIPISEFDRANIAARIENISISTSSRTPLEYLDYLSKNGSDYTVLKLQGGLTRNTLNRGIFPDRGSRQSLSGEFVIGQLQYYKLNYRHTKYFSLTKSLTLQLKADLGYGNSFGDTTELPFYQNYYAGGPRSVRGFSANTLGPKDSADNPLGGNFRAVGNVDLIFPVPFVKDSKAWRFTTFFDAGNVFDTEGEGSGGAALRYSAGVGLTWLSPFGALSASIAAPFNDESEDKVENFQFTFGQGF